MIACGWFDTAISAVGSVLILGIGLPVMIGMWRDILRRK